MNVELRLNGIAGETLGYAAAGMLQTRLFVNAGDYLLFPVFKKYNALRDEIITVYPKGGTDRAWYTQLQLGDGGQNEYSLDVSTLVTGSFSTGTAWLIIDNQASDTGIQLQKGGAVQKTSTGFATINNGFPRTFQIDMSKVPGSASSYASSTNIAAYTLGRAGDQYEIGNHDLYVDKIYKVTVTGSFNNGTVRISDPIQDGTVSMDDFENE
jgi:hypothetical protein